MRPSNLAITNAAFFKQFVVLSLIAVSALFHHISYAQSQVANVSPRGTKYWLYTPPNYNPATSAIYPVLLSLHGGSAIGDNLSLLTAGHQTPAKLIAENIWPASRPFIVVSPQLKRDLNFSNYNDQEWPVSVVNEVLNDVASRYKVDASRIYLTGISLGAAGGWDYITAYPTKIAAFVPISGKTRTENACIVKNTPIWAFHGENDGLVKPKFTLDMVNSINACVPAGVYKTHVNLMHARGHEGWNEVFNGSAGYDIFDWLLQFILGNSSNKSPYVNAGIDQRILLPATSLHLASMYFDTDGTIASATWTKVSGPAVTVDQTNPKFLKLTNLTAGTYTFELLVIDNSGASKSDQVVLEVLNSVPLNEAAITDIKLINSNGVVEIGSLYDGMVIAKTSLGTDKFNFKAQGNTSTGSIRFRISTDRSVTMSNVNTQKFTYMKDPTKSAWVIPNGEYTVCATAYKSSAGRNAPGLSLIFKIIVNDVAVTPQTFYSKNNSPDISSLASWSSTANGLGTAPTSFTSNNQTFIVSNAATVANPLNVTGSSSSLWVKNGGNLTLNSSATNLNTEGNAIITINTNQSVTFGTMSTTSTINFGSAATSIPAKQYGTITLKGIGSTKTLSSGTTSISGTLTIENGVTLNAGTSQLTLMGDLTNNGGTLTPAASTISLSGTTTQTLTGSNNFSNLVISKTSGNVNLNGTGSTTINNTLTLTKGIIFSTSTNKLSLGLNGTISGGASTSFIDGPLVKTLGSAGTFTFPVGSNSTSRFRPATLTSTSAQDTWTVIYHGYNPSNDNYFHNVFNPTTLSRVSQFEYWDVSRTGSTSATLTLSYNTGSYNPPNIGNVTKLMIAHWDGAKWDLPTGGGTVTRSGNDVIGAVTVTNVTSFSPHTIGAFDSALPVNWLSFTAGRNNNGGVTLKWATSFERNNDYFDIERSFDATTFKSIGSRPTLGNGSKEQYYEFVDREASNNVAYYYRIKQVDYDRQFAFSKIISISANGKINTRWSAYPNPIGDHEPFHIRLEDKSTDTESLLEVNMIAANGSIVFRGKGVLNDLNLKLEDVLHNLSPGIYTIQLSDGIYRQHFRIARY